MTTNNWNDQSVLAYLDNLHNLAMGLDEMLHDLGLVIYTMAGHGQCTDNPLTLYSAVVEFANHAKTLHAQETEAMHMGAAQS
jgi:hypothetical protein